MDQIAIEGVILTPSKRIYNPKGDIFHAIKKCDIGYNGFGEAYFTTIKYGEIKAWRKHLQMTLNLVVPIGKIKFVVYDDRERNLGSFFEVVLSRENYQRLTVPPGVWLGFQGLGKEHNIALNIANVEHNPDESVSKEMDSFAYNWEPT